MKRLASKKSYSWWWDSHISPKNSKWLAENLEDMDKLVKEMLKLIDEEGDSFAKKAEMYYKRRPELISHVEDFYRMYRSLAERYDSVTGELRSTMEAKLHPSQGSAEVSDFSFGSPSPSAEQIPNHKHPQSKRKHRAPGFEFFLGSGGSSDVSRHASDSSSFSSDSESESEKVKEENALDADVQRQTIIQLENELIDLKQKLLEYEEGSRSGSWRFTENEHVEDLRSRSLDMEKELSDAVERLHVSEEEIMRLTEELERKNQPPETYSTENGDEFLSSRVLELEKELISANHRVSVLDGDIMQLKQELERNTLTSTMTLGELKAEITASEKTISELHMQISGVHEAYKQDILRLEAGIADRECSIQQLQSSIQFVCNEKSALEAKTLEQELEIEELKTTLAKSTEKFSEDRSRLEKEMLELSEYHATLKVRLDKLDEEKRQIEADKAELCSSSAKHIEELNKNLDDLKHNIDILKSEKDDLDARVHVLNNDVKSRDNQISDVSSHLQQLHLEIAKLIEETDKSQSVNKSLQVQVKELEAEVELQRVAISDGAEGKREAIRQLCFSIDHYRICYQELCHALQSRKQQHTALVS